VGRVRWPKSARFSPGAAPYRRMCRRIWCGRSISGAIWPTGRARARPIPHAHQPDLQPHAGEGAGTQDPRLGGRADRRHRGARIVRIHRRFFETFSDRHLHRHDGPPARFAGTLRRLGEPAAQRYLGASGRGRCARYSTICARRSTRAGLEMVRMVPATAPHCRSAPMITRGTKGMDNMVVRRLTDGKLVMEGRFAPVAG